MSFRVVASMKCLHLFNIRKRNTPWFVNAFDALLESGPISLFLYSPILNSLDFENMGVGLGECQWGTSLTASLQGKRAVTITGLYLEHLEMFHSEGRP